MNDLAVWLNGHNISVMAVLATLGFNFFFLPPLYTLTLQDSRNWFALLVFLVTAVVVSELAAGQRRRASASSRRPSKRTSSTRSRKTSPSPKL